MRLWSIHPSQLDRAALIAVWREGLLAKKVLEGRTKGDINHPQLQRFKETTRPVQYINNYLHSVADEAEGRGYAFDRSKLLPERPSLAPIKLHDGQLNYEWHHLLRKTILRQPNHYQSFKGIQPSPHPLFVVVKGDTESWEVVRES